MNQNTKTVPFHLSGLGWWNLYFIVKIALYFKGTIGFHPIDNFALLLFILVPIRHNILNVIRHIMAVPLAAAVIYYDSFLPPFQRLIAQFNQLMQFEFSYQLELIGRFMSLHSLMGFFVLAAGFYLLNKFFRVTIFVIATMVYICFLKQTTMVPLPITPNQQIQNTQPTTTNTSSSQPITVPLINDQVLNNLKADFFTQEANRKVTFSTQDSKDTPFDVLFLSICSVAWDDIKMANLENHPLFKEFDFMFDNFNAATSYSGPAVLRLLRASCGQEAHGKLFSPAPSQQCYIFNDLKKLGFNENLLMNHNGLFDDFINLIKKDGDLQTNLMPEKGFTPYEKAFDGSSIYRDKQVLNHWWQQRLKSDSNKVVALYNTISLHDGNRIIGAPSRSSIDSYKYRLKNLLDDLYGFFQVLKASNRNIVVALVPEHGAGMRGDKMQISGMREIPAKTIIHTPVGLKIFGPGIKRINNQVHIKGPSSYLALSQLISNILSNNIYQSKTFDPSKLAHDLPTTRIVAQNSGSTVMKVNGKYYVSLDGSTWSEYPE